MSSLYDAMKTPDSFKDLGVDFKYSVINLQKQVTSQIESFSSIIKLSEDPARKASSDEYINAIFKALKGIAIFNSFLLLDDLSELDNKFQQASDCIDAALEKKEEEIEDLSNRCDSLLCV